MEPALGPPQEASSGSRPKRRFAVEDRVGFWRRTLYLLGPVVATALLWFLLRALVSPRFAHEMVVAGGASLFGFGTTVIFGPAILPELADLTNWELALLVMWVNGASGFWYAYNLDLLQKVPRIGPYLRRARLNAVRTLKYRPWIRRFSVVGVAAFVVTPLPGSGALGGCLMGRLIGVSKRACFVAVSMAGMIVAVAYALLADELKDLLDHGNIPNWARVVGALIVVLMMVLLVRWVRSIARVEPDEVAQDVAAS